MWSYVYIRPNTATWQNSDSEDDDCYDYDESIQVDATLELENGLQQTMTLQFGLDGERLKYIVDVMINDIPGRIEYNMTCEGFVSHEIYHKIEINYQGQPCIANIKTSEIVEDDSILVYVQILNSNGVQIGLFESCKNIDVIVSNMRRNIDGESAQKLLSLKMSKYINAEIYSVII